MSDALPVRRPEPAPAPTVTTLGDEISPRPFPSPPPGFVLRAVLWLRRRVLGLANRLAPPEVRVFEMAIGSAVTHLLGAAARHRIADRLAQGPLTAAELAAQTELDPDALHRALRALAALDVFTLLPDGRFANNRYANALRGGRLLRMREYAEYFASGSNLRAWADSEATLRTGKNAFERVHGMSVWDWFDAHPDERENFAQLMMGLTTMDAPAIAKLYPWHEVQRVCDVAGGRGTLISELLVRHRHLRAVLCDAPGVLESARVLLEQRGVAGRAELVPGNIFAEVPIGADAYTLKNVLHDWDDARSLQILGVVRKAMKPGARLLVCEMLTERNDPYGLGVLSDVHMMMVCSDGRERSRQEYADLLTKSGFRPARVLASPMMSVIEGIAVS
jgi:hypothetical protein